MNQRKINTAIITKLPMKIMIEFQTPTFCRTVFPAPRLSFLDEESDEIEVTLTTQDGFF